MNRHPSTTMCNDTQARYHVSAALPPAVAFVTRRLERHLQYSTLVPRSPQLTVGKSVELEIEGEQPPARVEMSVFGASPAEFLLCLSKKTPAPANLEEGRRVTVRFTSAMGLHLLRTTILRVTHSNTLVVAIARPDLVVAVAHSDKEEVIQQRRFFRVPACLVVKAKVLASSVESSVDQQDERALSHDISASGLRFETSLALTLGDRLHLVVEVPRGLRKKLPKELACQAKVVRLSKTTRRGKELHLVGAEFDFAVENERTRWVQLMFDLQRGAQL